MEKTCRGWLGRHCCIRPNISDQRFEISEDDLDDQEVLVIAIAMSLEDDSGEEDAKEDVEVDVEDGVEEDEGTIGEGAEDDPRA